MAADAVSNQVFVPIRGNLGQAMGPTGNLCSKGKDVFGLAGSDNFGCIAIFGAPSDSDDRPAKRAKHARGDD